MSLAFYIAAAVVAGIGLFVPTTWALLAAVGLIAVGHALAGR